VRSGRRRDRSEQDDARSMADRLKPKLLKYGGKKRRMLEAITTAVSVYAADRTLLVNAVD